MTPEDQALLLRHFDPELVDIDTLTVDRDDSGFIHVHDGDVHVASILEFDGPEPDNEPPPPAPVVRERWSFGVKYYRLTGWLRQLTIQGNPEKFRARRPPPARASRTWAGRGRGLARPAVHRGDGGAAASALWALASPIRGARVAEDDEALRPHGGHGDGRREAPNQRYAGKFHPGPRRSAAVRR